MVTVLINHSLTTESINPNTNNIDSLSTEGILTIMNQEDAKITTAIQDVLKEIENAVDLVFNAIKNGGHIFFVGAGTSGRLGVLEAAECPPTFGVSPELFQGIIAGGDNAVFKSVESAEDQEIQGMIDLEKRNVSDRDIVIGIAASGRTPYVIGALKWAKKNKVKTISVSCNRDSIIGGIADQKIEPVVGPEVISGSTRMKAGTATKMILNMITTAAMIKMGKVYKNLMVDLNVSNLKLRERAVHILENTTEVSEEKAREFLDAANYDVKTAIVMIKKGLDYKKAKSLLDHVNGYVRLAIDHENEVDESF
ncbi:N-acetylmuramic acid 6-phosphate etherase [Camelliibacillus cellulosilyticus]|uniref:N-acetylmuramic acid 6-phosphate etherase n=1 Tax=Camelliibacillus cellulosilyticus TaxID=2174486 RepID=A0ABV9GMJ6_9BACL